MNENKITSSLKTGSPLNILYKQNNIFFVPFACFMVIRYPYLGVSRSGSPDSDYVTMNTGRGSSSSGTDSSEGGLLSAGFGIPIGSGSEIRRPLRCPSVKSDSNTFSNSSTTQSVESNRQDFYKDTKIKKEKL